MTSYIPKPELDSRRLRVEALVVTQSPGCLGHDGSSGKSNSVGERVAISLNIGHLWPHDGIDVDDPTCTERLPYQLTTTHKYPPNPF
jgi:hypothetical protein